MTAVAHSQTVSKRLVKKCSACRLLIAYGPLFVLPIGHLRRSALGVWSRGEVTRTKFEDARRVGRG